jgi:hypothetical protein
LTPAGTVAEWARPAQASNRALPSAFKEHFGFMRVSILVKKLAGF